MIKLIATVDVHALRNGPQSMRRIKTAIVFDVFFQPPHIGISFLIEKIVPAQIVYIGTFCVYDFTEHAIAGHVEGQQFKEIIAAVFQHHHVLFGFL